MKIIRLKDVETTITPIGFAANFAVDERSAEVINLMLEPGQVVSQHEATVDTLFYVVEGKGSIESGDQVEAVRPTDMVVSYAGSPRGLRAASDSGLSVLIIKTPNPKHI